MPTMVNLRSLLRSRRLAVAVAAAVTIGGVAAAASARSGDQKAQAPSGPTATATVRDLTTTLKTTGVVERVDHRTISYAAAQAAPTAGDTGPAAGAATGTSATPAGPAETTPTTNPESQGRTTPTTAPSSPTSTTPTTTTTTNSAPPTDPTTTDPGTTGTESPSTTATTAPAPHGDGSPTTTTTTPAPANADPATTTTTLPTSTTTTTVTATTATTGATSTDSATGSDEEDTPTLTGILAVGVEATRGAVLYTTDDEPTVALFGTIPLWRTLEVGVDAGADVRQLEENLVALGYGSGVTVDNTFTTGTANAVKRWETALGRTDPDGTVELGDVVYLTGAGTVLTHDATVGEPLDTGTPILRIGSDEQVITAKVPAEERAGWTPGITVNLTWADATTTTGTISVVSSDVVDEQVEITLALTGADRDRPSGAEVTITAVDIRHNGVVSVPVAAIVAGTESGRAVRVPASDHTDRLTPVQTGLVADGWIEITTGLKAGENVRLPG